MRPGERLLVWRLKRSDRDACSELIHRHHRSVYGYLRRLGADTHLAEDLTQETYAKAWANVAGLREAASLGPASYDRPQRTYALGAPQAAAIWPTP